MGATAKRPRLLEQVRRWAWAAEEPPERVDVGIGRGTISRAYGRLGIDGDAQRARFDEGYQVLRKA